MEVNYVGEREGRYEGLGDSITRLISNDGDVIEVGIAL